MFIIVFQIIVYRLGSAATVSC